MKNMMKKLGLLFATVVMIMLFAFSVSALEPTGQCGDNVYWSFDETTGELVISGTGPMTDYYDYEPFSGSNIKSVVITDGVTTIGDLVFTGASKITSITIPDSVTSIGNNAFSRCSMLKSITIPDSVTTIDYSAFSGCTSLESITIPDSVTTIRHGAFNNTAYYNNSSNWKNDVLYIENHLIEAKASLSGSYTIKEGTKVIANLAFINCDSPISIIIPDSVINIGADAFYSCNGLTCITIPGSIKTIGFSAFSSCKNLENVYYNGSEEQWNKINIERYNECLTTATIHYHTHIYNAVVTAPTCTAQGYTTYTCECGDTYVNNYTDKLDHDYTSVVTTEPTHLTEGVKTFTCKCGDTYTKPVAKLEGHTYEKVATAPTCTEKGYTTYVCECGDNYVSDYVGAKAHNYTSTVTKSATHLTEGLKTYTCSSCGNEYTEKIAKTPQHTYTTSKITKPTCTDKGYTSHYCECGDSYNDNYTSAIGHKYNGQITCINCGKECSCNCHKKGISNFFWKIGNFFNKLFKIKSKQTCACGVAHY
jgi:hypothetical protein